jgi:bifunctional non-homologous end joining protein LigD
VRLKQRDARQNWLLIKERDAEARPGSGDAVVAQYRISVVSGRDLDAVAAMRDRVSR